METVSRVERPTQTHSPVHTEASVNCRKTAPTVLEIKGSEAPFTRLFNSIVGLYHRLIAFLKEKWDSLFSKKSEPVLQQKTDPHLAALEKAFEQAARAQSRSSRGESAELYYNGARSSDPLTEKNLLRTNGGVLPMRKPPATAASLGHALRFEVEKTEYEMKLRVLSGDEPTEIILKKVKKTITEGPMGQKQLEFWVLEKCAISQFGTEAQKKIVAQVCSLMNESKIPYLQYSQRLAKFNPFLFEPYLKPSGYPSILTLKTNAG